MGHYRENQHQTQPAHGTGTHLWGASVREELVEREDICLLLDSLFFINAYYHFISTQFTPLFVARTVSKRSVQPNYGQF